ncbi:hypothetical protein [Halosegnis marinus]|uniref:Uncharacterized protein n=1 Tax=Halosegnis marinus TaxID=3034023 RepID=A0ABD5ZR03_9EURY|nr:hypothetical protein [Halosegnis sp. DT85]
MEEESNRAVLKQFAKIGFGSVHADAADLISTIDDFFIDKQLLL